MTTDKYTEEPVVKLVALEGCKAQVPEDCKYLQRVVLPKRGNKDPLYVMQNGYIHVQSEYSDLTAIEIEYIPYNMKNMEKALEWMKTVYIGFPEYTYMEAVRYTDADFTFKNMTMITRHVSHHEKFLQEIKMFFQRKARSLYPFVKQH